MGPQEQRRPTIRARPPTAQVGIIGQLVRSVAVGMSRRDFAKRALALGAVASLVRPFEVVQAAVNCDASCCRCTSPCTNGSACTGTCCSPNGAYCFECCCNCGCAGCCGEFQAEEQVCNDGSHSCTCPAGCRQGG